MLRRSFRRLELIRAWGVVQRAMPGLALPLAWAALLPSAGLAAAPAAGSGAPASARPNVIVILADDQGYHDAGFRGNAMLETPHLDRLAAEGTVFDHFRVAAPTCSPSRASLLTGRYPERTGVTRELVPGEATGLRPEVETLGEVFARAGYATGFVGKWHVGEAEGQRPWERGFESRAVLLGAEPPSHFDPPLHYGAGELREEQGYDVEILTREAVAFVERHRERPFLLWLAYPVPHDPIDPPPERYARVLARQPAGLPPATRERRAAHYAMLEALDDGLGAVLAALEAHALASRTVVVYLSDNGGLFGPRAVIAHPLLAGRGMLLEGGMRVPFVVRWPGAVPPGRKTGAPLTALDLFPTLCEAAGIAIDPARELDGASRLDWWRGAEPKGQPPLFFATYGPGKQPVPAHWPKRGIQQAMWDGPWKYLRTKHGRQSKEALFHLEETHSLQESRSLREIFPGIYERTLSTLQRDKRGGARFFEVMNRIAEHPERAARMKAAVAAFEAAMKSGARAPAELPGEETTKSQSGAGAGR